MCFRNYGFRKTWLDIRLKSPFSEDPFTANMVNGPKNCCNLTATSIKIFSYHFEDNCVGKSLL